MGTRYFCAHCDEEFTPDAEGEEPRCPRCMRRGAVEPVRDRRAAWRERRRWLQLGLALLVLIALGYAITQTGTGRLEAIVPERPLAADETIAYLEREGIQASPYASMLVLGSTVEGFPAETMPLAEAIGAETSRWSLEHTLPREVLTADAVFGALANSEARVKLYPLESAASMVALLRDRGVKAMVAEAWELSGEETPLDPSGMLGYFVVAVYDSDDDTPRAYVDPWGGRGILEPTGVRVLRDTEVIAAALGTEAVRIFASSGDGAKALPMVERALSLDPRAPTLRIVHATILIESGGTPQALEELRAAVELRPDGPRKLHQAQLTLAEGAMLEANGQSAGAAERFADANRVVVDVLERWPRYGRAHLTMATVHLGLGDRERARYELERAESSSPDSPLLWAAWAEYDLGEDELEAALAKMRRAVRIDPENWQLRVQAAIVAARAGAEGEAREQAEEALRRVASARRAQVREYLDRVLEDAPTPAPAGNTRADEPALMLGDPSKLRIRSSKNQLELDPDLRLDLEE